MALVTLIVPSETAWTGAVVSENGEILTTSESLGEAPFVEIRLWDGTRGQACVTGRDDDIGLALLEPLIEPPRAYDYLALSGEPPSVGQELELFQHARLSPVLYQRATKVAGYRSMGDGYGYILWNAAGDTIADGAVLLDESGRMAGMRMSWLWLLRNRMTNPGEFVAIDAWGIASALPALRSGRMHILPAPSSPDHVPPSLPVLFHGEVTIDGAPAPAGTVVYAKVTWEGEEDYWQSILLGMTGEYVFPVSTYAGVRSEGVVEFWVDCKRSLTTGAYEYPPFKAIERDLAF